MMCKIDMGIDSFSCTYSLTPKQKDSILGALRMLPKFQTTYSDYFDHTYDYTSDCFAGQGLKLRVSRYKGSIWNLAVTIHPTLLLGNADRSALFHPNKETVKEVMHRADTPLKQIHCPCKLKDMKLYRVDVTVNLIFETSSLVESYLCILRMLYLLQKTSNRKSLSAAIGDLSVKFGLKSGQITRTLKKFDKLGISPITLINTDSEESFPALAVFLK